MQNHLIRISVRTMYDMQKLRIQCGNRIVAAFRVKLGLDSQEAEESDENANKILNDLRAEYKRITDPVKRITKNFKSDSAILTTRGELALIEAYERQLQAEAVHEKAILYELGNEPIWTEWLQNVRGVGPLMAGVILSEIDFTKCNSISALWKYCGVDVVVYDKDGETVEEGRSRKREHLVPKTYTNRDGEIIETVGISFNPFVKTKLVGVLGSVFIKLGGEYREIYDGYKHRLQHHPKHKDKSKGHIHNMAVRYMIKEFLADLWTHARTLKGLPVRPRYSEEKLGIVHSRPWQDSRNIVNKRDKRTD